MINDPVQEFQAIKQKHRNIEMQIAKEKSQAEIYKQEIGKMLAEEGVASVEELKAKYLAKTQELSELTAKATAEIALATPILEKLRGN